MRKLKIAIVHDDFIQSGGAEFFLIDILKELKKDKNLELKVFSPIISNSWKEKFNKMNIEYEESFLGKIPFVDKFSKIFFLTPLFYISLESFDFMEFDVVFSSSTRFAHSVITRPETTHISYINSPSKMLWEVEKYYFGKKLLYWLVKNFLPSKRIYDFYTQQRSDVVVANSQNILEKIYKTYRRESNIIYPFINQNELEINSENHKVMPDYYILISRVVPWKRIDYVIDAFNENNQKLLIIGKGDSKYLDELKSRSKKNIEFTGFLPSNLKYFYLKNAQALILPQDEDFGLVILESLNLGTPVIYFNKGGAKEILSQTYGIPFSIQNKESLQNALQEFQNMTFPKSELVNYASNFSSENFKKNLFKFMNISKL